MKKDKQHRQRPCVPLSPFHYPKRVWKILFFWRGHISDWYSLWLRHQTSGLQQGFPKSASMRRQGHHTLPEDRQAGRIMPPQKIRILEADTSPAFCSCMEKGTWLMDFHLSQSKETFAFCFFSLCGGFSWARVPPSQVGTHCHLLAPCFFTPRRAFLGQSHVDCPREPIRHIRKYQ